MTVLLLVNQTERPFSGKRTDIQLMLWNTTINFQPSV